VVDAGRLRAEVAALLAEPERLRAMSAAARAVARPDAAARIAEVALEMAAKGGKRAGG
jgi:UDP-N-acetylglucosamine:LPS N-acetylglucosamine transferase